MMSSSILLRAIIVLLSCWTSSIGGNLDSFSFFKFSGPVSGNVEEILVSDQAELSAGIRKIDYTATPDYSFHYGVRDAKTGNAQGHKEIRNGDSVSGEYRVLQDDGLVRIVRYRADPFTGFQAHIEYAASDPLPDNS